MTHVGISYEPVTVHGERGLLLHQEKFCLALTTIPIDPKRAKQLNDKVTPAEQSQLRGSLGGLLFLCSTRNDLIADVIGLQTHICAPLVLHLKAANTLTNRAKLTPRRGLLFLKLTPPLRALSISDASFATSKTSYAIEGILNLITEDTMAKKATSSVLDVAETKKLLNIKAHCLMVTGKKAKRISHSTSHAESLAAHGSLTGAELLAMRYTEIFLAPNARITDLLWYDDHAVYDLPIDHVTDCFDLVELVSGTRGVPQDRSQRLLVLSLREKRMIGKLRHLMHCDTHDMAGNRLTKFDGQDYALLQLMDTGKLCFKHGVTFRAAVQKPWATYSGEDLHNRDLNQMD